MALDPEVDLYQVDKLESDVREMCKKVSEYRQTTIPPDHHHHHHHLRRNTCTALSSSHAAPNINSGSDPLPSSARLTISLEAEIPPLVLLGTEEHDRGQRMIQLKDTVSKNAANTPLLVNRVRDCVDKLDSLKSRTIHPAFTKPNRITPP